MSEETTNEATIPSVHAAYVVVLNANGTLNTTLVKPGSPIFFEVERPATTYDVFVTSKELVHEIETSLLADRVAATVLKSLQPKDSTAETAEKIKEALSDRGIETPVVE